jgi:Mg2+ and Co2+ transporter CorA
MNVLTIIMALLAPATLIASIFGMNIPLPGGVASGNMLPLGIISSIMLFIAVGMYTYLRHNRWI